MSERRYNDEEVAAIFKLAAESQHTNQPSLPSSQGMTLAQLQEIGREVGISSDHLTAASHAVGLSWRPSSRQFLGLPIGVGLSVDLNRKVTDAEWEQFVVDLRETFEARGAQRKDGSFRQWTNGNLQALIEPTAQGDRLRFRTVKGNVQSMMIGGLAMFGFGAIAAVTLIGRGFADHGASMALMTLAAAGLGSIGYGAFSLPGWAQLRRRQMQELATRLALELAERTDPR